MLRPSRPATPWLHNSGSCRSLARIGFEAAERRTAAALVSSTDQCQSAVTIRLVELDVLQDLRPGDILSVPISSSVERAVSSLSSSESRHERCAARGARP